MTTRLRDHCDSRILLRDRVGPLDPGGSGWFISGRSRHRLRDLRPVRYPLPIHFDWSDRSRRPPGKRSPWEAPADETSPVSRQRHGRPLQRRHGRPARTATIARSKFPDDAHRSRRMGSSSTTPADPDHQFVVGWDALIYPALAVGEPANLDEDILKLADSNHLPIGPRPGDGPYDRLPAGSCRFSLSGTSRSIRQIGIASIGFWSTQFTHDVSGLPACSGSGRVDLAETLFAAATPWTTQGASNQPDQLRIQFARNPGSRLP